MAYTTPVDERLIYDNAPERGYDGRPPSYVPTRLGTSDWAYGKLDTYTDEDVYDLGWTSAGTTLSFYFDGFIWDSGEYGASALSSATLRIIDSAGNIERSYSFFDLSAYQFAFNFTALSYDRYYFVVDSYTTGQYSAAIGVFNYAPSDITVSATLTVKEFAATGTAAGRVTGHDADDANLTYALISDAGGRFNINASTGQLTVENGLLLDFEQRSSHIITVRVTDPVGAAYYENFIVTIGDVNPENITGNATANTLVGGASNDVLSGAGGNDWLEGRSGNDRLDGGVGADRLVGGTGNDTFFVDNAGDRVFEAAGQGTDVVYASVGYSLTVGQHVETLATNYAAGTGAINLAGNELSQRLIGNNGVNGLYGYAGNDQLYGNGGNDTLHGGLGADRMVGGLGNDIFYVDNAADKVFEAASQGTDTVYSSVGYALSAGQHVETLATTLLAGTGAIHLTGNELGQRINGNNGNNGLNGLAGNDVLAGYGGHDWLKGGAGNDTLAGGAGFDNFVFDTALNAATNIDRITDFNVTADTIRLDNAVMPGLGATLGTLSAAKFWKSTAGIAHDADDRIIYDIDTGRLFYDSNGKTAGGATHFATLAPNLALTNADFVVI